MFALYQRNSWSSSSTCFGKLKKSGEPEVGELPFGGQHDNEYVLRGMRWADNYWLFSDNREILICMVNDIIEELLDLHMEPKPESLWWTSTHKHEDMRTACGEQRQGLGSPLL